MNGNTVQAIDDDDDRKWYFVHCQPGKENVARYAIKQQIEMMGMHDKIFDVIVPTTEEIVVEEGKRKAIKRRVISGYILVQMKVDKDSWSVVRNIPGVWADDEPVPLRQAEVHRFTNTYRLDDDRSTTVFWVGQKVCIIDGAFKDFVGRIGAVDMEKAKLFVILSFFGRETPVELDFLQVEKA